MSAARCILPALAAMALIATPGLAAAAQEGRHAPSEVVFLAEIVVLLVCGRLLGEAMQRIGQPAIIGQLIAGIVLGPSVLGMFWPDLQHALFPGAREQKAMLDAVSQLGILMLLLLTGMETDLSVVRRARGAAFSVSIAGIAVPFLCGFAAGWWLPDSMLPRPDLRLATALFLGTALSISSVKIVAIAIRDMGFMRRFIGQVTVAAAIIDDTIGWIILSIILGLVGSGQVELGALGRSVVGTLLFLAVSFTIGRRLVSRLIRWTNDNFVSDAAVITAILVVMGIMALITDAIGVHTVLGAFVAGILVGQSPILTRHIDAQLRGLIVALFMPVFFGLAGLNANIEMLGEPSLLLLTAALIAIASVGKFGGAFLGGALGGLTIREALALGCGMNARGSTEVIVASIGLSMGALSQTLFTMILAMAVVTTMSMPPLLRWTLARLPLRDEEKARLEREEFEAQGFVTNMERLLVAVDESPTARFVSRLVGLIAGARRIPTTMLHIEEETGTGAGRPSEATTKVKELAQVTAEAAIPDAVEPDATAPPVDITMKPRRQQLAEDVVVEEAKKGYDFLVIGAEPEPVDGAFDERIARIALGFKGPFAVAAARGVHRTDPTGRELDILVPVIGTAYSRRGAEVALALARADNGAVTALYVRRPPRRSWQGRFSRPLLAGLEGDAALRDIVALGDKLGVRVRTAVRAEGDPADAILAHLQAYRHNLLVMGVSPRQGPGLSFGSVAETMVEQADRSILLVAS